MRVVIGSDHAGFDQKEHLKAHIASWGHEVIDVGTDTGDESVDYPDLALAVGRAVGSGEADMGVLVCGTGIGMAIAANKVRGVRAASITDPDFAVLARQHNDANVLTISGRFVTAGTNELIVRAFLDTPFEGGRHGARVQKISDAEEASCE